MVDTSSKLKMSLKMEEIGSSEHSFRKNVVKKYLLGTKAGTRGNRRSRLEYAKRSREIMGYKNASCVATTN